MTVLFEMSRSGQRAAPRRPRNPRRRRQALGVLGLAVIIAIIAGAVLMFDQVFSPGVSATVLAPRAGLLMENGADVTLDGITVGRVTSITPDGTTGARLGISIQPGQVAYIPANVQAEIEAPSVFGPKFVNLVPPKQPSAQRVQTDEVIEPAQVSTEIDTVFGNLVSVLNSVHPSQVSATLGALSTALNGRGAKLGNFIGELDTYLKEFNPALPALGNDLSRAPTVAGAYSAAAPDLIKTLDNLRVTSGTLTSQQAQFDAFLLDTTGFAGNANSFLSSNADGITRTLATLLPTDDLLSEYSPELPCLSASAEQINQLTITDKLQMYTSLVPGANSYSNPGNLPTVAASSGPSCYGGPLTKAEAAKWGHVNFADGTQNYFSKSEIVTPGSGVSLAQELFGPAAAAATKAATSAASGKKGQ